jgi:hypothetical protein
MYIHIYINIYRVILVSGSESSVSVTQSLIWHLLSQNSKAVEAVCIYIYCVHMYLCIPSFVFIYVYMFTYMYFFVYIHSYLYGTFYLKIQRQ